MPNKVDETTFVSIDLPSFFCDDITLLGHAFYGHSGKATVGKDAVARKKGKGNALLHYIPNGG